ncbi:MAG: substrate-binding domain-containing protein [Pseudomonadota bacterium]
MTLRTISSVLFALLVAVATLAAPARATEIIVQSTTSTKNAGLYDYLAPKIRAATGITIRVVAVGTGQAIRNAQNCDGDLLLVHAKAAELAFVQAGYGSERRDLMYNDFVIVGPAKDPADVVSAKTAAGALAKIAASGSTFTSRGDDSGTHKKELALWAASGVDPSSASGTWYRETGSGMGATLNVGVGMGAYVLVDRATWLTFGNKADFAVLFEGDPALFNQYGVIPVSAKACPSVKADAARKVADWLVSPEGQSAIGGYQRAGRQLFFPNANAKPAG